MPRNDPQLDLDRGSRYDPHMSWRELIVVDPDVLVGKPIIKGTRISVEFVLDLLAKGWTMEKVLGEYDHLTRDDLQACLGYASEVLKDEKIFPIPT